MTEWPTQAAKARFSELLEAAQDGPVVVSRHGQPRAVVLSWKAYERLRGRRVPDSPLRRFYERVRGETAWEPPRMPRERARKIAL